MWVARYLMMRLCESYGIDINWHCKPLGKDVDWNGSGMHSNFSTAHMRDVGGKEYFEKLMAAFDKYKNEHIAVYGPENHLRLTGLHETQSIDKFNYVHCRTVALPCAFRIASWITVTKVISKTAVRNLRKVTRIRLPAAFCRRSTRCRPPVVANPKPSKPQ